MSYTWHWEHDREPTGSQPAAFRRAPLQRQKARLEALREQVSDCVDGIRETRSEVLRLVGAESHTGDDLSCLYVGHRGNLPYLQQLIYRDTPREELLGKIRSWAAPRAVRRHEGGSQIVIVDVGYPYTKLFGSRQYLRTPSWLNQSLAMPDTWQRALAGFTDDARRNVKRVRKHKLTARVTMSDEDATHFYREMYLPHVKRRFKEATVIEPENKVRYFIRHFGLLQVVREGQVLSGTVLYREGSTIKNLWGGLASGVENELRSVAMAGRYYFSVVHAYEHGYALLDFCGSRSMLDDGVLRTKRKWGARLSPSTEPEEILLRPRDFSVPVVSFFTNKPFLSESGSGYRARFLHHSAPLDSSEVEKALDDNETPGIESFEFHSTRGFHPKTLELARDDARVVLRDLGGAKDPAKAFCAT